MKKTVLSLFTITLLVTGCGNSDNEEDFVPPIPATSNVSEVESTNLDDNTFATDDLGSYLNINMEQLAIDVETAFNDETSELPNEFLDGRGDESGCYDDYCTDLAYENYFFIEVTNGWDAITETEYRMTVHPIISYYSKYDEMTYYGLSEMNFDHDKENDINVISGLEIDIWDGLSSVKEVQDEVKTFYADNYNSTSEESVQLYDMNGSLINNENMTSLTFDEILDMIGTDTFTAYNADFGDTQARLEDDEANLVKDLGTDNVYYTDYTNMYDTDEPRDDEISLMLYIGNLDDMNEKETYPVKAYHLNFYYSYVDNELLIDELDVTDYAYNTSALAINEVFESKKGVDVVDFNILTKMDDEQITNLKSLIEASN